MLKFVSRLHEQEVEDDKSDVVIASPGSDHETIAPSVAGSSKFFGATPSKEEAKAIPGASGISLENVKSDTLSTELKKRPSSMRGSQGQEQPLDEDGSEY
ncbi:hypothetical protein PoB_001445600 [Plakobranchus ocellatus]|uniref:Uncharacterized protein n=1 Tax=Plakobranchus ocellatus TaxID=259542 RepID=A0AAV3YKZ4_9GAST|nr:hypothetical protein PoB_001445600 [Plakobranchus ocellatus]